MEQDLSNCKAEHTERERRINDFITGKRYEAEISVEQTMKEKDTRIQVHTTKDARIQALEKHLERKKDELMMERKGHQAEKQMYLKKDKLHNQFLQESERLSLELKNVKKASELLFDELEKVNKDKHSLPEIKVYQEKLQKALLSVFSEFGVLVRTDAT
ncbi:hypothetical protein FEM48_Zijuj07G0136800 [Ziziphus jujuba var. spinosa]|uniref:Uncharacterized protein n=1 Tax=Ziziphus jujuba var. spinosa TaxID=714518 RepID=A0A978V4Y9_ZIZJJ|nr:hypothetical protein FEM48_Zijuj07G0136800 [Ziziphus jujuba var. spinosa]